MRDDKYRPRSFKFDEPGPEPVSLINEVMPDNVIALPKTRSLHAVLVESLTNTKALLARLEAGITVSRDGQQREVVRLLYVATRHQVAALAAVLELEGLE